MVLKIIHRRLQKTISAYVGLPPDFLKASAYKRPAALLEVLIALSLIAICAVPLIRQPIANHQAEMAQIEKVEEGRIAAWTFTEIKEKLLKNEIRWSQIPPLTKQSAPFTLKNAPLQIPPLKAREIKRSFTLKTLEEKQEPDGRTYRLLAIKLQIGKNPYTYRLTVFSEDTSPQENTTN